MRSGAFHCNRLVALLLLMGGAAAFFQGAEASTVTFVDPNLEDAVRTAIGKPSGAIDTADLVSTPPRFTSLNASYRNIQDLTGLEFCTDLTRLQLYDNKITDISRLTNLTQLEELYLWNNEIADLTPLTGLTKLRAVFLQNNLFDDITGLYENSGIADGAVVNIKGTILNQDSLCNMVPALIARNVTVFYDGVCGNVVVDIPDANLEKKIRVAINKPTGTLLDSDLSKRSFTSLDASDAGIVDLTGLDHCINLTRLQLGGNRVSNISALSNLGKISRLYLGGNAISDLTPLKTLYALVYLEAQGQYQEVEQPVGVIKRTRVLSSVDGVQFLPGLQALFVHDNNIADISSLKWLVNLKYLSVGNQHNDAGKPVLSDFSVVRNMPDLVSLDIGNNKISSLAPVAELFNLQFLVASHQYDFDTTGAEVRLLTGFTDPTQNYLVDLTELLLLDLSGNQITDISGISDLSLLTAVYLNDNKINNIAALASLPDLAVVMLQNNKVSDLSPLVANTGVGATPVSYLQDRVDVRGNSLSQESLCNDIPALLDRRVIVYYDGVCCVESDRFTLTTLTRGEGTVEPKGTGQFCRNTKVTLTAKASTDWVFDHWEGDLTGTANPADIIINSNLRITAVFGKPSENVTLTVAVVGNGTVVPSVGTHTYAAGSQETIKATPGTGYLFDHWEGAVTGTLNPATLIMDVNKSVTAVFVAEPPKFVLTTQVKGNGSITPAKGDHSYVSGTAVSIKATPDLGWVFDHWEGDVVGTSPNPTSVVMTKNKTVTAVFRPDGFDFTLAMVAEGNGVTDPPVGFHRFFSNDHLIVSAIGDPGWVFDHWTGSLTGDENPVEVVMDENKTLTAVFIIAPVQYTVDVAVQGQGAVKPMAGSHVYAAGKKLTLEATPAYGWAFDHWSGSLGGAANPALLTVDGNKSVVAVFRQTPLITQVSPNTGNTTGGEAVTISGSRLATATGVKFGAVAGTITSASDTQLSVTTPAHDRGIVDVTVETTTDSATSINAFTFVDPQSPPKIGMIIPNMGSAFGSVFTQAGVTIRGEHFTTTRSVKFAGKESTAFEIIDDSALLVAYPAYVNIPDDIDNLPPLPFAADVTVTTSNGSDTLQDGFTYVLSPYVQTVTPAEGHVSGGDTIVLAGIGLANPTSVTLGGVEAQVSSSGDTRLVIITPPHPAATVDVKVVNDGGSFIMRGAFNYFTGAGTISVHVFNAATQAPILNATVLLDPLSKIITGSQNGVYVFDRLHPGVYKVTVLTDQCQPQNKQVTVLKDQDAPVAFLMQCTEEHDNICGLQLKRLDSTITETTMPLSLNASPGSTVAPDATLAIRLASPDGIDPGSVWAAAEAGNWAASGGAWRSTTVGDNRDGWVTFTAPGYLPEGQEVTLTVGALTAKGAVVGPLSQVFKVQSGQKSACNETALVEEPSIEKLPELVAVAKSPAYRIVPAAVFADAYTVQAPAPDGIAPAKLEIYYYSESILHPGWYRATNVAGWFVPGSMKTVEIDGKTFIEFQVNHAGVFQLAQPMKLALGGAGIEYGFSGARTSWVSLAMILMALSVGIGLLVRRGKKA